MNVLYTCISKVVLVINDGLLTINTICLGVFIDNFQISNCLNNIVAEPGCLMHITLAFLLRIKHALTTMCLIIVIILVVLMGHRVNVRLVESHVLKNIVVAQIIFLDNGWVRSVRTHTVLFISQIMGLLILCHLNSNLY